MHPKRRRDIIRILILVFYFAGPSIVRGQTFSREQIVGVWTSKEVSFTNPASQAPVEKIVAEKTKRGLTNSKFVFQSNGLFFLHLPAGAPTEFRELEAMNNKMWHIRSKERMVFVGSLEENLIAIDIKIMNGFYYFFIQDTPLILRMERNR